MNDFGHPLRYSLRNKLCSLYGEEAGRKCVERLSMLIGRYGVDECLSDMGEQWSERDILLITYGDMVRAEQERPLQTLRRFLDDRVAEVIRNVHILPFCPFSSDDGFSVIDYRAVNPELGSWQDINAIASGYRLMADLVLNHCSRHSEWFTDYAKGVAPRRSYFISLPQDTDLSQVVRPRTSPLLTEVHTLRGIRHVWTTFSDDQIDLNFQNPDVLFEFLDILLFYISKGVNIFRLDAIAYLWKEVGTSCIHLPQTHQVVKIFRDILTLVLPRGILITETNVPHEENVSYFGDSNEAHVVYQFALPPLVLHALQNANARYLTRWAAKLEDPPAGCTFLNFTASHDGIGVRPLEGLVPKKEVKKLAALVKRLGGQVSTKANPDGSQTPYELNTTYFDALTDEGNPDMEKHIARFLCSQTIPLALQGIPAVYFNNLFGANNDYVGMRETGRARSLNRQKWQYPDLGKKLDNLSCPAGKIFHEYKRRMQVRIAQPAFHPDADQDVLNLGDTLFAIMRHSLADDSCIVALHNMTGEETTVPLEDLPQRVQKNGTTLDLLAAENSLLAKKIPMAPYQCRWLTAPSD